MASVMTKQGTDEGSVRKAESLPNVHLAEEKILGSVTELPRDFIPVDKSCRACVKLEGEGEDLIMDSDNR